MNNDELAKMISVQKETIEQIKEQQTHTDLKEFYLNKYQEMIQEIIEERLKEINNELIQLDQEIENINISVSRIDEDIQTNELTKQKIEIVEQKIYAIYAKIEEERYTSETVCDKLQRKTIELCNEHHLSIQPWFKILNDYYNGFITNGELLSKIDELKSLMNGKCYDLSVQIKLNELENRRLEETLEAKIKDHRAGLDQLIKEKERYEQYIYDVSVDKKMALKKDLEIRIEHKKHYLKEIQEAFNDASKKQLKEFSDLYNKNNLISKPTNEQVEEYDDLFKKFKSRLLMVDTKSNLDYQRKKRLSFLEQEKVRLSEIKTKKDLIDEKVQRYQEAYQVVTQTIKDLDEHVNQIKKEIQNYKYQQFIRFNDQFTKELNDGLKDIKHQQQLIESLKEERTYRLFEPIPEKIKEIDEMIHKEEVILNDIIKKYDLVKKDYEAFLQENENNHLKELLEDGQYFEEKIPVLKDMLSMLKTKIGNMCNQSNEYLSQLKDYQDVLMQIEELKYEDYN